MLLSSQLMGCTYHLNEGFFVLITRF